MMTTLLVFSAMLTSSTAADYTKVGVKAGDTLDYSVSANIGVPLTGTAHVAVVGVVGTNVTMTVVFTMTNGTQESLGTIWGNVSNGYSGIGIPMFVFMICPNLAAGDAAVIDSEGSSFLVINGTTTMVAAGASRQVNYILESFDMRTAPPAGGQLAPIPPQVYVGMYWDKLTGVTAQCITNLGGDWMNFTLTSTSLWLPDIVPIVLIGAAVGGVVIAGIAVYLLKFRKK